MSVSLWPYNRTFLNKSMDIELYPPLELYVHATLFRSLQILDVLDLIGHTFQSFKLDHFVCDSMNLYIEIESWQKTSFLLTFWERERLREPSETQLTNEHLHRWTATYTAKVIIEFGYQLISWILDNTTHLLSRIFDSPEILWYVYSDT